jgi:hypothetical protein
MECPEGTVKTLTSKAICIVEAEPASSGLYFVSATRIATPLFLPSSRL